MTSRLRHKLEIDPSVGGSSNLNESFVLIGTPLPALGDTKRDKGEFVPIWKQEVRDEKGRQRFHGAFTGGFTAGFGNTVGSKEGWTPSTFVSSRNARSSKQQRAEDFMDEEDLEQMKEGRQLENNEGFRNEGFAGTQEELKSRGPAEDPFTSTLSSLIQPARTSIGHTLLQKLGWRPGQGIGPRVSARKRKLQAQKLGLPLNDDEELDGEQMSKHTFAPRDVRLLVYEPKQGGEGLGFVKGLREALPGIDDGPSLDEDPYSANATASTSAEGNRFAFDLDDDDGDVIMMGAVSTKSKAKGKTKVAPLTSAGPVDQWHDGRPVPAGFVLDPKPVVSDKWFPMPDVPKDWTPRPSRLWEKGKKWDQQPGQAPIDDKGPAGRRTLTAEQRGAALGEEARKKSVFDYMSQKEKERLEAFAAAVKSGHAPVPVAPGAAPPTPIPAAPLPTSIEVPPLSPRTASAALKGFIPFGDDPDKQDRYRSYLTSQCHNTDTPNPSLLPNKPLVEQQRELNEFQKSGQMFKPMSFAMSNRFTSASAVLAASDSKISQSGLYVPDPNAAKAEAEESVTKMEVELTPRQQAAKNGMHGTMTRTVNDFYPVKLLCKRFGVADPHPGGAKAKAGAGGESGLGLPTELGAPLKTDISWTDKFIHVPGAEAITDPEPADAGAPKSSKPKSLGEVGLGEDENQGKDTLTYTKPSIDIFKAIFASDDEDDSDEEDDDVPFVPPTRLGVPKVAPTINEDDDKPVDLATFKPVFVARGSDKSKDKKKKKDKKRKGLLTFDMDEGEGHGDVDEKAERERKEKKRRKKEEEEEEKKNAKQDTVEDGEDEWVEKPAVVQQVGQGRKSAADYM